MTISPFMSASLICVIVYVYYIIVSKYIIKYRVRKTDEGYLCEHTGLFFYKKYYPCEITDVSVYGDYISSYAIFDTENKAIEYINYIKK